jgi:hypothetical protein
MTGEMREIDGDGCDTNGEEWPTHAYVARRLRAPLRAFDVYCGPYIETDEGWLFLQSDDGDVLTAVLWAGGVPPAHRAPITAQCGGIGDHAAALRAARAVIARLHADCDDRKYAQRRSGCRGKGGGGVGQRVNRVGRPHVAF